MQVLYVMFLNIFCICRSTLRTIYWLWHVQMHVFEYGSLVIICDNSWGNFVAIYLLFKVIYEVSLCIHALQAFRAKASGNVERKQRNTVTYVEVNMQHKIGVILEYARKDILSVMLIDECVVLL